MTEKIKDRLTSFLVGLLFTLLTFIAGGVGWLIAQNVYKDAEQDRFILKNTENISKVARIVAHDENTEKEDRDELRQIYFNARSSNQKEQ